MTFGYEGVPQQHWSEENLGLAMNKLQEKPPSFGDEGNTGEKDGKYRIMGYEVLKPQYDEFLEKVTALYEEVTKEKQEELKKAA